MTTSHQKNPNGSYYDSSQWVELEDIIESLAIANDLNDTHIRAVLMANGLNTVRPVIEDLSPIRLMDEETLSNIIVTKLSPLSVRKECIPEEMRHFSDNKILSFQIPSLIRWIKYRKLKLAIPKQWTQWMESEFPALKAEGLAYADADAQSNTEAAPSGMRFDNISATPSTMVQLKDVYKDFGIKRNQFEKHVRPYLNEIKMGRGVLFLRSELEAWATEQTSIHSKENLEHTGKRTRHSNQWQSTNGKTLGGLDSQHQAEKEYDALLKHPTKSKHKNLKTD